jgi:hypothetical protein
MKRAERCTVVGYEEHGAVMNRWREYLRGILGVAASTTVPVGVTVARPLDFRQNHGAEAAPMVRGHCA